MLLDPSVRQQTYVEDCEVCCRPLEVQVVMEEGELVTFDVKNQEG